MNNIGIYASAQVWTIVAKAVNDRQALTPDEAVTVKDCLYEINCAIEDARQDAEIPAAHPSDDSDAIR